MLAGGSYDFYRVLERRLRPAPWLVQAGDLLVWVVFAGLIFAVLQCCNQGELRLFVLLGLAAGALFYRRFFRRTVIRVESRLLELFLGAAVRAGRAAAWPFGLAVRAVRIPLAGAARLASGRRRAGSFFAEKFKNFGPVSRILGGGGE